ncbi:MAG: 4Fe-4S binding protein [Candidatus Hydromicrobium sp.]
MIEKIKETVKKLFKENKIDIFIGYSEGTLPLRSTPCFITEPDDIEKLVWNSYCFNNLTVYLPKFFLPQLQKKDVKLPRIGILAKGCDGRSIVGLIKEHQIPRENIYIIGIACKGMIDIKKIQNAGCKMQEVEIVAAEEKNGKVLVEDEDKKKIELEKEELLAEVCKSCQYTAPLIYDVLIGEEKRKTKEEERAAFIEEFEKKPLEERWKYFQEQVSKCIRCYACRQACPNCYCKECFAEQTKPEWIGITDNISDIMFFQIGRIFHQAGRCVDCGACVRACPMGIDLRIFTYKLIRDVKEFFGYEAGISLEEAPPLATFKSDDKQEFITEP